MEIIKDLKMNLQTLESAYNFHVNQEEYFYDLTAQENQFVS